MKITKNTIILSNRESRAAGHHSDGDVDDSADGFWREIKHAAHDLADRTGRHVEVYATQRGRQAWVVYACEAAGGSPSVMPSLQTNSPSAWGSE